MSTFQSSDYGPVLGPLVAIDRNRDLGRGTPDRAWRDQLDPLTADEAWAHTRLVDRGAADACLAGVWLLHDFLDESHAISQGLATAEGSYWHGVMHRREGDFDNAKYWFRRVGNHPLLAELAATQGRWDAALFVDRCAAAVRSGTGVEDCVARQRHEWERLFDWCYRLAVGAG